MEPVDTCTAALVISLAILQTMAWLFGLVNGVYGRRESDPHMRYAFIPHPSKPPMRPIVF